MTRPIGVAGSHAAGVPDALEVCSIRADRGLIEVHLSAGVLYLTPIDRDRLITQLNQPDGRTR